MSRCINLDDDRFLQILYDEACVEGNRTETIYKKLCEIADADVQPLRIGKWIEQEEPYINTYECSNCGRWFVLDYGTPEENGYNYCPNCGARMEQENETERTKAEI